MTSCGSIKHALPPHQIFIAINEKFKPYNITVSGHFLQDNITKAYDRLLDSLSTIYGYKYFPNYRLPDKHQATLILKGTFGVQDWNASLKKYFVSGVFINTSDSLTFPAIGVFNNDSLDLFNNIVEYALKEKSQKNPIDPIVPTTLRMSGTLVSLVPYGNILLPKNGNDSLTSFSINNYIYTRIKKDRRIAAILTNLMNNILAFNQHSVGLYLKRNKDIKYNYYPNYRLKKHKKEAAKYNIGGKLIELGNKLILSLRGPNLNLIAPSKIDTVLFINKDRILSDDYADVIINLSQRLDTFTWQQGNIFN